MHFNHFPKNWCHRLNFKPFAFNLRPNNIPNVWCFCSNHLNPVIISSDSQQVTFTCVHNNQPFSISAIYAFTNHIIRRQLWNTLQNLWTNLNLPWCSIDDFDSILGSHEHRGSPALARTPMTDFFNWFDSNNFIHLPTRGVQLTWSNGRQGNKHIERRLGRVICNHSCMELCSSINVQL